MKGPGPPGPVPVVPCACPMDTRPAIRTGRRASAARSLIQYWDTNERPAYISNLCATFREHNPDFAHRVYDEREAEDLVAEHFGLRERLAFRACAVPSMQSDYFRYCAVLALGGIYSDADYKCIRPLGAMLDGLDQGEVFLGPTGHDGGGSSTPRIWSGFFAFRDPGHPFLRLALDISTANIESRMAERVWPAGKNVVVAIWLTVGPGVPTLMWSMYRKGSFDAFRRSAQGSLAEPFADLYCEAIGDYERLRAAFEGVRVSSFERLSQWVAHPSEPLPYKETDLHWHNVTTPIFR